MNTYLKLASAATLSAVAVSVAALSVPAVQVQALKLIERLGISQALVTNVTVKPDNVVRAPELDDTILIGLGALDLTHLASDGGENAGGVLPVSRVLAGTASAGGSNGQPPMAGGAGFGRGGGGSSSAFGLGVAARAAGGGNASPAGAGEPGAAPRAPVATQPDAGNPGNPGSNPTLEIAAPGDSGDDGFDTSPEVDKVVAGLAELPSGMEEGSSGDPLLNNGLLPAGQPQLAAVSAIPEPGTLALLGIALLGLGAFRRQRARK